MRARNYDSRIMKPVKSEFEGIKFESSWELSVYQNLRLLFPKEFIKCHEAMEVLPGNDFFPPLNWRVDFSIQLPDRANPFYIEAKGVFNREFKLTLQALGHTNPKALSRLIVCHPQSGIRVCIGNRTVNIHALVSFLSSMKAST